MGRAMISKMNQGEECTLLSTNPRNPVNVAVLCRDRHRRYFVACSIQAAIYKGILQQVLRHLASNEWITAIVFRPLVVDSD